MRQTKNPNCPNIFDPDGVVFAVMIGDTGCILCITDYKDVAERIAWNYNSYLDSAMSEREDNSPSRKHNELRPKVLKEWKFTINKDLYDPTIKAKVVQIPKFSMPVKFIKGFMDSYSVSAYARNRVNTIEKAL